MGTDNISSEMLAILVVWIAMIILVSRMTMRSRDGSVGLPAAFLFSMTFLYCGAFIYLNPDYSPFVTGNLYLLSYGFNKDTVLLGALATVIGVVGFTVGCWLAGKMGSTMAVQAGPIVLDQGYRQAFILVLGLFALAGFVLNAFPPMFPMQQIIMQVGRNAAVVVICLGAALSVLVDGRRSYMKWVVLASAIPITYLVVWGFVSYGFIVFTLFAGFWLSVLASRRLGAIRIGFSAAAITYGLLSAFVAYMSFRTELREVIWGGADFGSRISAIIDAFGNTKLLNPFDFESLDWLNTRLNQYIFVGKAIEYHELVPDLWLNGQSLLLALVAWVPRVLWPGKPAMGGSHFVAEHTGMAFSQSATFGAGPVFEFYVNFGYIGVFLGFVALGLVIRTIDRYAARALKQGRLLSFVRLFTVGIAFIAPLTDIFFMVSTAVMSWLVISAFGPVTIFVMRKNTPSFRTRQSLFREDDRDREAVGRRRQ